MSDSTQNEQHTSATEKKKISLQDAIKQKLASKKQAQQTAQNGQQRASGSQKMKSQQTKKPNNQRRRTGV
ncbi:hypothetical protein [Aneurinibacillus uraniidurans]|uniref:hypothetical protein n=1 Tax=Aneurinibacillus uraniidurans TaxID=2966586 RepID=UPI00234A7E57|nr:hypothetical protein [Aneurinibacillus sp. B1]WCN37933.1 hypothetical protein PO771_00400 [Aneurinibacillus sp. B1]